MKEVPATMDLSGSMAYYVEPGYIYLSKAAVSVRTVVGSCVAVCLWDRTLRYGAMNHFLRPYAPSPERRTPQYGDVAMPTLVRMMMEAGCQRCHLQAQILGGGFPRNAVRNNVGAQNVAVAREFLNHRDIKVVSEDVGGCMGRKVVYDTGTGQSAVLKVHRLRASDWWVSLP